MQMGFRVGHQCVSTQLMADDLVLSAQPPLLTADGKVLRPVRTEKGWYYEGKAIQLHYPPCSEIEQMQQGAILGGSLIMLFALAYGFRLVIKAVQDLTRVGGDDN